MPDTEKDILKEIRDEFEYYENEWHDIREEGKKDMRYVAGDPWDPQEKRVRKDAERPCLAFDELSQFVNQLLNDPKQNPRAIKISPKGEGASDQTARTRESLIREIQYNSKAQAAFTTGFQGTVQRSYGAWRVGSRYKNDSSFEQELYIGRIPNPDAVLVHPNYKELDASDKDGCFVIDKMRVADFKRKYPNAEITDFTPTQINLAPQWLQDNEIMVAEYWKISIEQKKLYMIEGKKGPEALWQHELPKNMDRVNVKRERTVEYRTVKQYETNGVEILGEPVTIEIPIIPIITCLGEELFVDDGGGSKRKLFSLIRRARDPYMYYCYIRSCQAEMTGISPKVPWVGVVGQFATYEEQWQLANKQPYAYLQYDMIIDSSGRPLPAPQRAALDLPIQGLEILAEGARRAIQAAMGITPLPTAAQRQNEKSGVALKSIQSQEDLGSFGFIDNYNCALESTGRVLDAWIPIIYDVADEVSVMDADETRRSIRINDPNYEEPNDEGRPVKTHYDTTTGEHGVIVSTGPNFESQREEASDFVSLLMQNIGKLPIPPDAQAKLLALTVKLKNIGPLGDEMADIISPPADQVARQQQIAQGAMQLQQQTQVIQEMQQELQKLQLEKAGRVIDNQFKLQIEGMKAKNDEQLAQMDNDIQVLKALLASKQNISDQEYETFRQFWIENHGAAHEVAMQAMQHQHDAAQLQQTQAASAQSQQSDQQHEADQATQAQDAAQLAAQSSAQPGATTPGQ